MENMDYYDNLKDSLKSAAQFATSDSLHYGIFLLIVLILGLKIADLCFRPFRKKKNILANFLFACLKALWIFVLGMKICSLSSFLTGFTEQILMSSSLIVVVLGFVFQEGLTNIVHGFILTTFKPFHIGDRVRITIDGEGITGYITSIDLRSTVIQNVMNSSYVIIPNSKMDMCVIENSYFDAKSASTNFLDFAITYESNLEKAMAITAEEIMSHPLVDAARTAHEITDPVTVMVRSLDESGIAMRATVMTGTIEENFTACSEIRKSLVERFRQEPDIAFAYLHVQMASSSPVPVAEHSINL